MSNHDNDLSIEGLIDHLTLVLKDKFGSEISQIYFGDIGIYPPMAFKDANGNNKCVVALVPSFSHPDTKSGRTAATEFRDVQIKIVIMANLTPFFEAMPKEAYAERLLLRLAAKVQEFFSKDDNTTLEGRIYGSSVGNIDWEWQQRKNLAIRAVAVDLNCKFYVRRQ